MTKLFIQEIIISFTLYLESPITPASTVCWFFLGFFVCLLLFFFLGGGFSFVVVVGGYFVCFCFCWCCWLCVSGPYRPCDGNLPVVSRQRASDAESFSNVPWQCYVLGALQWEKIKYIHVCQYIIRNKHSRDYNELMELLNQILYRTRPLVISTNNTVHIKDANVLYPIL